MRLRRNQVCPVHRSLSCCGREAIQKERRPRRLGVRRIDDPQHPCGYREMRLQRRNAEAAQSQDCDPGRHLRNLQREVHRLQRRRPRSHQPPRHGRRVAGRSPRQHSGRALVVQRGERIEPLLTGGPNIRRLRVEPYQSRRKPSIEFSTTGMQGSRSYGGCYSCRKEPRENRDQIRAEVKAVRFRFK